VVEIKYSAWALPLALGSKQITGHINHFKIVDVKRFELNSQTVNNLQISDFL